MSEPFPVGPPQGPPPEAPPDSPWQRLDPRMLFVHPVREIVKFLPVLVGLFLASTAAERGTYFQAFVIVIPIAIGIVRYATTRYRIHDERVELRRGLISTRLTATPLDRVRTVDLTASPVHRLLGVATLRIGTGTASKEGEDALDLDGLGAQQARELRAVLLNSIARAAPTDAAAAPLPPGGGERLVARFEPGWLRFAPFTSAGFVLAAGVIGVGSQVLDGLGFFSDIDGDEIDSALVSAGALLAIPALMITVAVLVAVFAVLGYLVANGNFALSHTTPDGSWHVRRGLLTTRETSLDDDRLRGAAIGEPWGLRLVHGGRLNAIVTGLNRSESGSSSLLPPTPRDLVDRVAAEVVGTAAPVQAALRDHGPRARARRYVRALVPSAIVAAAVVALAVGIGAGWLSVLAVIPLLLGAGLAVDRARSLGHGLVDDWFVARSGSLTRKRELLAADAIIGWNLQSTWFQRRAGLVTLTATTAGGSQSVTALDVPARDAVAVADTAVPGLLSQFLDA
ncbi:PH domain-containing protein [Nocardioides sp.]|uniref:PH domain-containing protein n=1 Tax=Nocardioides sp. TaxID=35761 RepID=UPI002ED1E777